MGQGRTGLSTRCTRNKQERAMKRYGFVLLLVLAVTVRAEDAPPSCSDCHEQQGKSFVTNPHARGAVVKGVVSNDTCATCHGDGAEHIAGGGDKTKIAVPRGLAGSNDTCALCHEQPRG